MYDRECRPNAHCFYYDHLIGTESEILVSTHLREKVIQLMFQLQDMDDYKPTTSIA